MICTHLTQELAKDEESLIDSVKRLAHTLNHKAQIVHCSQCDAPFQHLWLCLTVRSIIQKPLILLRSTRALQTLNPSSDQPPFHINSLRLIVIQLLVHPGAISLQTHLVHCYVCDNDWDLEELADSSRPADTLKRIAQYITRQIPMRDYDVQMSAPTQPRKSYLPGVCGLHNLGNTCYLNSALQCLGNTPALVDYFLNCQELFQSKAEKFAFVADFASFIRTLWSGEYNVFSPRNIVADLFRLHPQFSNFAQQDSHECITAIIDSLHEQTKDEDFEAYNAALAKLKKEESQQSTNNNQGKGGRSPRKSLPPRIYSSMVSAIFEGVLRSSVQCLACGNVSNTLDRCYGISVCIPNSTLQSLINKRKEYFGNSVTHDNSGIFSRLASWIGLRQRSVDLLDCLHGFCCSDELKGSNRYKCEHCKKHQDAQKTMLIERPPEVLCIHIKRFRYDSFLGTKVSDHVNFPLHDLDIAPFCSAPNGQEGGLQPILYDLIGLIMHIGSLGGGHYVAYVRNTTTNKWYCFDDSIVSEVSETEVLNAQAYVLFYKRKMTTERQLEIQQVERSLHSNVPSQEVCYVSKFWYQKFKTLVDPGPMSNLGIMCKHGQINREIVPRISRLIVPLPKPVFDALQRKYGGKGINCNEKEVCSICLDALTLAKKRETELAAITQYDRRSISEGEYWYIIPVGWLTHWLNFASKQITDEPPGRLHTEILLNEDGSPKVGLRRIVDYRGICKEVWDYFSSVYGAGPAIIRKTLDIYSEPVILNDDNEDMEE